MGFLTGVSWEEINAELLKYSLVDGTRPFTGPVGGVDPVVGADLTTKNYVDNAIAAVSLEYYLTDTASDIATYLRMQNTQTGQAQSTVVTAGVGTGTITLEEWATPSGFPALTELREGLYDIHLHAKVNAVAGTKVAVLFAEIYSRTVGGVETLRITTESTGALTTSETPYHIHGNVATPITLDPTDRLVVKIRATVSGAGADPTITLYMEGTTDAHVSIPVELAAVSHGVLSGLANDDHTQYALLAGRSGKNDFTGFITATTGFGVGVDPTAANVISIRKDQVDTTQINVDNRDTTANGSVQARIRFYNGAHEFMFGLMGQNADGFGIGQDEACYFYSDTTAPLITHLNGAQRMRIKDGVYIGSANLDAATNSLYVEGDIASYAKFGCNNKAAQASYASGGALAAYAAGANGLSSGAEMSALHALVVAIRAALVANGIMS